MNNVIKKSTLRVKFLSILKSGQLIDLHLTHFNTWIMFKTDKESTQLKAMPIYNRRSHRSMQLPNEITIVGHDSGSSDENELSNSRRNDSNVDDDDDEVDVDEERIFDKSFTDLDLKEVYLKLIFAPFRFSKSNILKSLGVIISIHIYVLLAEEAILINC